VPKWLAWLLLVLVLAGFAGSVWAFSFHERTSQAEVDRLVYARYGRAGAPIRCVSQRDNRSVFYCYSVRFGDDPNCVLVDVDVLGNVTVADKVAACEGA
jgi:hypothetical protein